MSGRTGVGLATSEKEEQHFPSEVTLWWDQDPVTAGGDAWHAAGHAGHAKRQDVQSPKEAFIPLAC